jgi:Tol biopolymer transport system component
MPVMDRTRGALDLWTVEIATGSARRVSTLTATHDSPVFSPDASRIVYGKAYGHSPVLAMLALEPGVAVQTLPAGVPAGNFQQPSDWSPDGRFVAETSTPIAHPGSQQNADIYLVDLSRNSELVPLLVGPRQEFGAVFSPDGRSIAFIADDSGRMEAYVQIFDPEKRELTGVRHQISHGGARLLRWPRPGEEIFYLGADSSIYSTDRQGQAKRLFPIPQQANYMLHPPFSFDVAAGGEKFLLPAYRGDRPLYLSVVLNWENLLAPQGH